MSDVQDPARIQADDSLPSRSARLTRSYQLLAFTSADLRLLPPTALFFQTFRAASSFFSPPLSSPIAFSSTFTTPHGSTLRQLPRVKSGTASGREPLRTEVSVSSHRQLVAA